MRGINTKLILPCFGFNSLCNLGPDYDNGVTMIAEIWNISIEIFHISVIIVTHEVAKFVSIPQTRIGSDKNCPRNLHFTMWSFEIRPIIIRTSRNQCLLQQISANEMLL